MSLLLSPALAGFALLLGAATPAAAGGFDDAVLQKINTVRANPAAYAQELRVYRSYFRGNQVRYPNGLIEMTIEGRGAVDEAIEFLERQAPMGPLAHDHVLTRSAFDHVADQGRTGRIGHGGSDGSTMSERIRRHGQWHGSAAENISYGQADPAAVVRQLIVDDGVLDRGHRSNMFDPVLKSVGVACGPHRIWREMCVMDFAGAVTNKVTQRVVASEYVPAGDVGESSDILERLARQDPYRR